MSIIYFSCIVEYCFFFVIVCGGCEFKTKSSMHVLLVASVLIITNQLRNIDWHQKIYTDRKDTWQATVCVPDSCSRLRKFCNPHMIMISVIKWSWSDNNHAGPQLGPIVDYPN